MSTHKSTLFENNWGAGYSIPDETIGDVMYEIELLGKPLKCCQCDTPLRFVSRVKVSNHEVKGKYVKHRCHPCLNDFMIGQHMEGSAICFSCRVPMIWLRGDVFECPSCEASFYLDASGQ
jgi:hypothetical protein